MANKIKGQSFEKINNIVRSLARLIVREREEIQINNIRNDKGHTDLVEGLFLKNHENFTNKFMPSNLKQQIKT